MHDNDQYFGKFEFLCSFQKNIILSNRTNYRASSDHFLRETLMIL